MIKYYWKNKKEFVKMIKENKVTVVVIATIILGALIEEIWQIKAIMMLMKGF